MCLPCLPPETCCPRSFQCQQHRQPLCLPPPASARTSQLLFPPRHPPLSSTMTSPAGSPTSAPPSSPQFSLGSLEVGSIGTNDTGPRRAGGASPEPSVGPFVWDPPLGECFSASPSWPPAPLALPACRLLPPTSRVRARRDGGPVCLGASRPS